MSDHFEMPAVLQEPSPPGLPPSLPAPPKRPVGWGRKWIRLALAAGVGALLVGSCVVWSGASGGRMADLTPESLAAARRKWQAQNIRSYDLQLETIASELKTTTVVALQVRDGRVMLFQVNGAPSAADPTAYTIEGLFEVMDQDQQLRRDPNGPYAGRSFHRVRFHPELGYPERYLRVIGGTGRSSEIRVTKLDVIASP